MGTKVILALIIGMSSPVYADCPQPVSVIHQGDQAACDGYIFTDGAEKQAEQYRSDADFYQKYSTALNQKTTLLQDENDVLQKRLNLYVQESKQLSDTVAKDDNTRMLWYGASFILGALVTYTAARAFRP